MNRFPTSGSVGDSAEVWCTWRPTNPEPRPVYPRPTPTGGDGGGGGTSGGDNGPYADTLCPSAKTANELSQDALMDQVDFDPDGNELPAAIRADRSGALTMSFNGIMSQRLALIVYDRRYKEDCHNDECDAFKHALLSAWTTLHIGDARSQELLDSRERFPRNPPEELAMDLYNNMIGQRIINQLRATGQTAISPPELMAAIQEAVDKGEFVTELPDDMCG